MFHTWTVFCCCLFWSAEAVGAAEYGDPGNGLPRPRGRLGNLPSCSLLAVVMCSKSCRLINLLCTVIQQIRVVCVDQAIARQSLLLLSLLMNGGADDTVDDEGEDNSVGAAAGDVVAFSRKKLAAVADFLSPWIAECRAQPCQSVQDSVGYRCRCAFQCVWRTETQQHGHNEQQQKRIMHYAIRRQQKAVLLTDDTFPIANIRIQKAMAALREVLNHDGSDANAMSCLSSNLTSISFSASWNDNPSLHSDCLVTLHYDKAIQDVTVWKSQAEEVCLALGLTQLTGRSRKRIVRALDGSTEPTIGDTIWIEQSRITRPHGEWKVSMDDPRQAGEVGSATKVQFCVRYKKPEEAFFHPNSRAMCRALEWMLTRLSLIDHGSIGEGRKAQLLELYCGCGAHTMALLKSGLLEKIVAVENDDRLVTACRRNYALNRDDDDCGANGKDPTPGSTTTTVEIVLADAAVWARDCSSASSIAEFDILLVDPPRQGLDERVCRMAIGGSFQHLLYISCGRDALVRDLDLLSNDFVVVDCTLLDLFPQTDAVESLVHLQRRKTKAIV